VLADSRFPRPIRWGGAVAQLPVPGLLAREHEGRGYRYHPKKSRDAFVSELAGSLLGRLVADFGDAALARIVEAADELSAAHAADLRKRVSDA
jgi:predicted transcriptional regulator